MILASFLCFMALFAGIGLWASSRHRDDTEDYLLAGRKVNPVLAGISAMASLMSGFVFIGYIGMVYQFGLYACWFFLGQLTGLLLMSAWLPQRIQALSARLRVQTFTGLLCHSAGDSAPTLKTLVALLTLIFISVYAAAQLTAGGKALNELFGWPQILGAVIGALILLLYSYSGGIRASIWTDATQAAVMFMALITLAVTGLTEIGGVSALYEALYAIDPGLLTMTPNGVGPAAQYFAGWLLGGLAILSLPHVSIRFMTVGSAGDARKAQCILLVLGASLFLLATLVALMARVFITALGDPELALPEMSTLLLPEALVGMVLAGIFASSMSSADSMVLSCSAALSQDLIPAWKGCYQQARRATLVVITVVFAISAWGPNGVFELVVFALGGIGAAFGPLLVVTALGHPPSERLALAMMGAGLLAALLWRYTFELHHQVFEAAPGVLCGFAIYAVGYAMQRCRGGNGSTARPAPE